MKRQEGAISYIAPHAKRQQESPRSEAKKAKEAQRIEKHSRLLKYLENKRLKEELDFIDRW